MVDREKQKARIRTGPYPVFSLNFDASLCDRPSIVEEREGGRDGEEERKILYAYKREKRRK